MIKKKRTPKEKDNSFALRLKAWRKHKGFTQDEAAAFLEVQPWSLKDWEQVRHTPLLSSVENVIRRLIKDGF